jgi:hypothetical protein
MFGEGQSNEHAERAWRFLREAVAHALPFAERSERELDALARAAWATVHGLATLPGEANEAIDERALDVVDAGLRAQR